METAQYLGYDTHVVTTRPKEHHSTNCTQSVVFCVGGLTHRQVLEQGRGQK